MSSQLTIDGRNNSYTNAQIAEFVRTNNHKPEEIAKAAAEAGIGLKQISEATGYSVESLSDSARQFGYEIKKEGATRTAVDLALQNPSPRSVSPNAIPLSPLQVPMIRDAVHGEGNKNITDEEIQNWFASAPRTPAGVMVAMVQYGVSAQQAGQAMGYSDARIEGFLVNYGLDKQALDDKEIKNRISMQPEQAEIVFHAIHGAGNTDFSDEEIQAWAVTHSAATPDQIVEAMVAYGVSANQVGRALGMDAQRVQELIFEYGVDPRTLAAKVSEGMTPADFKEWVNSVEDKQNGLKESSDQVGKSVTSFNLLTDEARISQDDAAQDEAAYNELKAQFDPAFAIYNNYGQERAGLEASIQAEQSQIASAQTVLANLGNIAEKHYQRQTAEKEANYQIDNANKNIAAIRERIAFLDGKMKEMEVWGIPLMEKTQAAQSKWESSFYTANEKTQIAGAQENMTRQATAQYAAGVADLTFTQQVIGSYLQQNPDLDASAEFDASLKDTVVVLNKTMKDQRAWVDQARQRGLTLENDAIQLEYNATEVKGGLDQLQPGLLKAEAEIESKQNNFNAAKAAEDQAQLKLDDAYKLRLAADYYAGSGDRKRHRDEAERLIVLYGTELESAKQNRVHAENELNVAKAEGFPAIQAGVEAAAPYRAAQTLASNARSQSLSELDTAKQLFDTESVTANALASVYTLMVGSTHAQVTTANALSDNGEISFKALGVVEDSTQNTLKYALSGLEQLQQTAAQDRFAADAERQTYTGLQAHAYGTELIADNELSDANYLQAVYDDNVNMSAREKKLADAAARLNQAKYSLEIADMKMDWAEAHVNQKRQNKQIAAAQAPLDAAKQELVDAQQAYDIAKSELESAQHLQRPLRDLALETGWSATSKYIDADVAGTQAMTQGGWASIAQGRYNMVDNIVSTVQGLVVQDTTGVAILQKEMAERAPDAATKELFSSQAKWGSEWSEKYQDQVNSVRQAEHKTYNDQLQLDELTIQASGMDALGTFLKNKAETLEPAYLQAKNALPELESIFQASTKVAQTDTEAAEVSRNAMTDAELQAMVDFVLSRPPKKGVIEPVESFNGKAAELLTKNAIAAYNQMAVQELTAQAQKNGVQEPKFSDEEIHNAALNLYAQNNNGSTQPTFTDAEIHRTAMQLFVDKAQEDAMAKRYTMRKQLHYVDDRQLSVDGDANVQAARASALQSGQTAEASTYKAIQDGEELQAGTYIAMLQGQRLLGANTQWVDAANAASVISAQAVTQANLIAEDYKAEETIHQNMVSSLTAYASGSLQLSENLSEQAKFIKDPDIAQRIVQQSKNLGEVAQAYVPVMQNSQILAQVANEASQDAVEYADSVESFSVKLKTSSDEAAAQLKTTQAMVEVDAKEFEAMYDRNSKELNKVYGFNDWARASVREHADKAKDAKELHEDRLRADQVYKIQKKKKLFKDIIGGFIDFVVTAGTMALFAPISPILGPMLGAMVGNAVSQGIKIGTGLQDEPFSFKSVAFTGLAAGVAVMALGSPIFTPMVQRIAAVGGGFFSGAMGAAVRGAAQFTADFALGATADLATQGIFNLIGIRKGIDWASVASMGLSAAGFSALRRMRLARASQMAPVAAGEVSTVGNAGKGGGTWLGRASIKGSGQNYASKVWNYLDDSLNPQTIWQRARVAYEPGKFLDLMSPNLTKEVFFRQGQEAFIDVFASLPYFATGRTWDGWYQAGSSISNFAGNKGDFFDTILLNEGNEDGSGRRNLSNT